MKNLKLIFFIIFCIFCIKDAQAKLRLDSISELYRKNDLTFNSLYGTGIGFGVSGWNGSSHTFGTTQKLNYFISNKKSVGISYVYDCNYMKGIINNRKEESSNFSRTIALSYNYHFLLKPRVSFKIGAGINYGFISYQFKSNDSLIGPFVDKGYDISVGYGVDFRPKKLFGKNLKNLYFTFDLSRSVSTLGGLTNRLNLNTIPRGLQHSYGIGIGYRF